MKKSRSALLLLALSALSSHALSACFAYDYIPVQLRGEVVLKAPKEIAQGAARHRKPEEKHAFLRLDEPICISEGPNAYESAEANQREIMLYTLKGASVGHYAGKHVTVKGTLMHAVVADAHTPLQLVVKGISEVQK